jgi:hypothetical protein
MCYARHGGSLRYRLGDMTSLTTLRMMMMMMMMMDDDDAGSQSVANSTVQ